ncbi:hypothetical protein BC834DRAFT_238678 [Gloeopeniophorella convolvens]|nr:hypothetical protein BC834DRAFT_238678 [Gloeopeniophorella convolvens]
MAEPIYAVVCVHLSPTDLAQPIQPCVKPASLDPRTTGNQPGLFGWHSRPGGSSAVVDPLLFPRLAYLSLRLLKILLSLSAPALDRSCPNQIRYIRLEVRGQEELRRYVSREAGNPERYWRLELLRCNRVNTPSRSHCNRACGPQGLAPFIKACAPPLTLRPEPQCVSRCK